MAGVAPLHLSEQIGTIPGSQQGLELGVDRLAIAQVESPVWFESQAICMCGSIRADKASSLEKADRQGVSDQAIRRQVAAALDQIGRLVRESPGSSVLISGKRKPARRDRTSGICKGSSSRISPSER